ncbi:protein transport protein Sec24C [Anabrus simplex]|uniref:protein transport protein Sec24C n=1 Tax=Anabrus simplex TaxID=316456 RepID=UPI0035A31573
MNPQYIPPQPQQYNGPPGGYPPGPQGPQKLGPQRPLGPGMVRAPQPNFGGPPMANGPGPYPPNMQGSAMGQGQLPPHMAPQRGPHTMGHPPPSSTPNQLTNQMAGMNISGGQRPPMPNSNFPGAPSKPGHPSQANSYPPGGFHPTLNGGPSPSPSPGLDQSSLQQKPMPPSTQYMNGAMSPQSHPGRGPLQGQMAGMPPMSQQGSMPPQPGGMQGPPGSMPPQPGGMQGPPGSMPPQPGGMHGPPGSMPPQPGGMHGPPGSMPPQPGGMHGPPGSMPPQPGGMQAPPGSMPPPPSSMSSQQGGSMPPQPGSLPPQSGGMPPQPGSLPPPQRNSMPQQPSGFPPQHGSMPPQPGGMHPQHGSMPPMPGSMPPPHSGMPPQPGGMPPQHGSMPPQHGGMPPQPGGMPQHSGMPPQPGSMPPRSGSMTQPPQPGGPMMSQPPGGMPPQPGGGPQYPSMGQMPPDMYSGNSGFSGPQQPVGPGGYPSSGPQTHPGMQPQQPRRLDPDQMPSPIQVMQDDQHNRSGVFYTNQKGLVPPLVTTNFVTQDQGNSGPRFIRSSMYNVPATIDMMKQTAVPFGLVVSPLARLADEEYPPPIVDMGELGPVRCIRCKAYMCPFMQFIDGGRRFHCLFCKATTEVPGEYFQHLDHTGQRVDRYERPELMLGTYEFVATKDYCRNNTFPKPPALIFLIDVSYNNIKSGMVHLLCREMKEILKLLPRENGAEKSNMRVGFITYNNTVHFYNVKGCLAQPQMMVVGDVQDMFMPLLEGFLCDPVDSEAVIDSLMEQIPAMFADTRETETVLAPAIQAGLEALKASECAGKLLVFHSSLPIAEAPGKLKNRDDRKLLGTEKEKTVLAPQTNIYNNLGQDCVGVGCSVDLFVFNNSYIDLATIGQVCRLTGGEIFKYTYFQADLDGDRLIQDIKRNVSRPVAFDAIMRVRTSTGVRATDFYGHFFMSNTTDMELASIDCDKAVAIEIKHDDKLTEEDGVYIQVALLYTSCGGQRRLRILNLSLKTCSQLADLYRSCDLDTIINFFSKQAVFRLLESSPKPVKDSLVNRCAQMLACYRKNCASPSSAGQLILPECMKLLPLYVNCILKSDAISGGSDMTIDDRSFVMQVVMIMDIPSSVVFFYPRLIPLHDIDVDSDEIPPPIRCSSDKIRDDGVYLLENGIHMFLWIGLNVGMNWVQNVFGVHSAAQIDIDRTTLQELDNPLSNRIRGLVDSVRQQRHRSMRLTLVRQRDKLEMVFKHFLVEDRGLDGSASYVDFLCHMHKEIRNLLS